MSILTPLVVVASILRPLLTPRLTPLAVCLPTNDNFSSVAGDFIGEITGGLGGLAMPLAIAVTVAIGTLAILTMLTHRGREYLRILPMPFIVVLVMILLIMLGGAIITIANNSC